MLDTSAVQNDAASLPVDLFVWTTAQDAANSATLAHAEALPDETARTAIGFTHRARAFFAASSISHVHRWRCR